MLFRRNEQFCGNYNVTTRKIWLNKMTRIGISSLMNIQIQLPVALISLPSRFPMLRAPTGNLFIKRIIRGVFFFFSFPSTVTTKDAQTQNWYFFHTKTNCNFISALEGFSRIFCSLVAQFTWCFYGSLFYLHSQHSYSLVSWSWKLVYFRILRVWLVVMERTFSSIHSMSIQQIVNCFIACRVEWKSMLNALTNDSSSTDFYTSYNLCPCTSVFSTWCVNCPIIKFMNAIMNNYWWYVIIFAEREDNITTLRMSILNFFTLKCCN